MALYLSDCARSSGYSLLHAATIGSTNAAGLDLLREGRDRVWVVADQQQSGRGRHGRIWSSPPGNLYASLALDAPCAPQHLPQLGFVAGVALAEAVARIAPGLAWLKWPNDLMIGIEKCAGLLLEGSGSRSGQGVVIGFGVNIAEVPEGLGRPATALGLHNPVFTRDFLFSHLTETFEATLRLFEKGAGFPIIRERWLSHAMPMGTGISVSLPTGRQEGRFAGLDNAGHLRLETQRGIETILAGDVFLVDEAAWTLQKETS